MPEDRDIRPNVGNGKLTIMHGITNLGEFTANQSGNTTINIPDSGGGASGGVTSIVAGSGIALSPTGGTGDVTVTGVVVTLSSTQPSSGKNGDV